MKKYNYFDDLIELCYQEKRIKRERIYEVIGNWLLVVAVGLLLVYCVIF